MYRLDRLLSIMAFALALASCASVPTDPNIAALAASNERLQVQQYAHAQALAESRAAAAVACANAKEPAVCALGQVAMTLASERSNTAPANPLNHYRAPPTRMQQFAQFTGAVSGLVGPLVNGYVMLDSNREREQTTRYLATANAAREVGIVQAIANLGGDIAAQPPGVFVGGNYGDTAIDNSQHGDTISDSGNVSDSYNTPTDIDVSGDGSIVGDGNDTTNGDSNDNSGEIRIESPGPIDNSDPGDDCSGESCNPVEPAPEPEG